MRYLILFFKGAGMGAANVIPGVSGGTIALITGIFQQLVDSLKSFDLTAIRYLFTGRLRAFAAHVNLGFLLAVFLGMIASIISLARVLDYLFTNYPVFVWSYFFGLILASVYYVGRTISRWSIPAITLFVAGTLVAMLVAFVKPASENEHFLYLFFSGIVAVCSMILPGLSGSFVLLLMGEYQLVMIEAVNELRIDILLPVVIGALTGLLLFAHLLSWLYRKFRDGTIALLTGFILGSLAILWPWKKEVYQVNDLGAIILKSSGKPVVEGYTYHLPAGMNSEVLIALLVMLGGIITIWITEYLAAKYAD